MQIKNTMQGLTLTAITAAEKRILCKFDLNNGLIYGK